MSIFYEYSSDNYKIFDEAIISKWIKESITREKKELGEINYQFVSDEEILQINRTYLNHDYYTDIITFDGCFVNIINGDIFISFETVYSNSEKFNLEKVREVYRVIIHGIMHLCGYPDKTYAEKSKMRSVEDYHLSYLEVL